jgi:nucleoside-diphosphate-sugar epimerase
LPSNQAPLGALPARFRKPRGLIVGCGDVGLRLLAQQRHVNWRVLTSSAERLPELRALGVVPLLGNLDEPLSLARLAGLAQRVVHLAPPPQAGVHDTRTQALARAMLRRSAPQAWVYGSTSGVYGDAQGAWVDESRPVNPANARAVRRVDAERRMRFYGRVRGTTVSVLRIPGIYAPNREGGTPRERLLRGTPVLQAQDDVFTNHIHADDLARACQLALWRGKSQRVYHVSDDTELKMADYFDLAAELYGLPKPARVSRSEAQRVLGEMTLSFMRESRRLRNTRMKRELRLRLRYPHVAQGLR